MAVDTFKNCPHCGDDHKGKPFAVYEDGYHCFSCGATKRAEYNFLKPRPTTASDITLPDDLEYNPVKFSTDILSWLMQYHLTDKQIRAHNIIQSGHDSIVMPVVVNDTIVMYQQRWFDSVRRIMTYGTKQPMFIGRGSDTMVIVEDYISAIRVGEVVDTCCMFGTSLPYDVLQDIVKNYKNVLVWADGDTAGQQAAVKILTKLNRIAYQVSKYRAYGDGLDKHIKNIYTERDPKCYVSSDIINIIEGKIYADILINSTANT